MAANDLLATSATGWVATMLTAASSFSVSYGSFCPIAGLISRELVPTSMVWPSAGAFATAAVATIVPAPGRFSITTDWPPQRADRRSARMRATTSVGPPAANGTTSFTGRDGNSAAVCAAAAATEVASRRTGAMTLNVFIICFSSVPAHSSSGRRVGKAQNRCARGVARLAHAILDSALDERVGNGEDAVATLASLPMSKKSPGRSRGEGPTTNGGITADRGSGRSRTARGVASTC